MTPARTAIRKHPVPLLPCSDTRAPLVAAGDPFNEGGRHDAAFDAGGAPVGAAVDAGWRRWHSHRDTDRGNRRADEGVREL